MKRKSVSLRVRPVVWKYPTVTANPMKTEEIKLRMANVYIMSP